MTFAKIMREKGFEPSCPERAPDPKTRARPPTTDGQGCSDTLESAGIGANLPADVTKSVTRDLRGFDTISGPRPGVGCFFVPPAGAFYWNGAWRVRSSTALPESQSGPRPVAPRALLAGPVAVQRPDSAGLSHGYRAYSASLHTVGGHR